MEEVSWVSSSSLTGSFELAGNKEKMSIVFAESKSMTCERFMMRLLVMSSEMTWLQNIAGRPYWVILFAIAIVWFVLCRKNGMLCVRWLNRYVLHQGRNGEINVLPQNLVRPLSDRNGIFIVIGDTSMVNGERFQIWIWYECCDTTYGTETVSIYPAGNNCSLLFESFLRKLNACFPFRRSQHRQITCTRTW